MPSGKRSRSRSRSSSIDESNLSCPFCPPPSPGPGAAADKETWVSCTHCKLWFHCICVSLSNPQDYSKWYCETCISAVPTLKNVERPPQRKSKRAKLQVDYAAIQEGMPADPVGRWVRLLENREFQEDRFRRMKGEDWSLEWLMRDPKALSEPVLVKATRGQKKQVEGLEPEETSIPGMLVPPRDMTIDDIAELVGIDTPVEVIDVASQSSSRAWTLGAWADYFATPKEQKKKVLNVISLEVTGTPMERLVQAPQLVRDMDWVTRDWPADKREKYPKVQRYVLMGVEGAYSDWHIDFAGSSVYYHVVSGQKTFLFAPPTPHNLAAYRAWCSSTRQDFDWLGDHVSGLTRVDIHPGETMLIPSGWLHSVYTPKNTLVVGGNFLTDWNVATQWKLVDIEESTKVPRKFRFPYLRRLTWYVAKGWEKRLEEDMPPRKVLGGVELIVNRLKDDLEFINDDNVDAKARKVIKEAIPPTVQPEQLIESLSERLEVALQNVDEVEKERKKSFKKEPRSPRPLKSPKKGSRRSSRVSLIAPDDSSLFSMAFSS